MLVIRHERFLNIKPKSRIPSGVSIQSREPGGDWFPLAAVRRELFERPGGNFCHSMVAMVREVTGWVVSHLDFSSHNARQPQSVASSTSRKQPIISLGQRRDAANVTKADENAAN
jgi:hypothetical protein